MAGNPADLGQPDVKGVFDAFANVIAQIRAGQIGQSHPNPKFFVSLVQGAFSIPGDLQDAIDIAVFVIQGYGLAVETELLADQVALGVDPEPVRPLDQGTGQPFWKVAGPCRAR
jgi:hypothetical protein